MNRKKISGVLASRVLLSMMSILSILLVSCAPAAPKEQPKPVSPNTPTAEAPKIIEKKKVTEKQKVTEIQKTSTSTNVTTVKSPVEPPVVLDDSLKVDLKKWEAVVRYLEKSVPEIGQYKAQIEKFSKGESKFIMRVDSVPNKGDEDRYKDDYIIFVGESRLGHTNRFATFYVNQDLKEIKVDNIANGKVVTLAEWRQEIMTPLD